MALPLLDHLLNKPLRIREQAQRRASGEPAHADLHALVLVHAQRVAIPRVLRRAPIARIEPRRVAPNDHVLLQAAEAVADEHSPGMPRRELLRVVVVRVDFDHAHRDAVLLHQLGRARERIRAVGLFDVHHRLTAVGQALLDHMDVEVAHLVDAHVRARRAALPDHACSLAVGNAVRKVLEIHRHLRRVKVRLPELPIEEVLHVGGRVVREDDLLRADRWRQELREVDRPDAQRPVLLGHRRIDGRVSVGVVGDPLAALDVLEHMPVWADIPVQARVWVAPYAVREIVVQRLLAAAGRALGVESVLAPALVPVVDVGIRPVRGRAHEREADVGGGQALLRLLHLLQGHLLHLVVGQDVHRDRLGCRAARGPREHEHRVADLAHPDVALALLPAAPVGRLHGHELVHGRDGSHHRHEALRGLDVREVRVRQEHADRRRAEPQPEVDRGQHLHDGEADLRALHEHQHEPVGLVQRARDLVVDPRHRRPVVELERLAVDLQAVLCQTLAPLAERLVLADHHLRGAQRHVVPEEHGAPLLIERRGRHLGPRLLDHRGVDMRVLPRRDRRRRPARVRFRVRVQAPERVLLAGRLREEPRIALIPGKHRV